MANSVIDLDSGVAIRITSPELCEIREELAAEFRGLLTAQDQGGWTPHVTIQNKAEPRLARVLLREMRAGFEPQPIDITGLQLVRYVEGEWEPVGHFAFRGPRPPRRYRHS
jgi:hypothetical protein